MHMKTGDQLIRFADGAVRIREVWNGSFMKGFINSTNGTHRFTTRESTMDELYPQYVWSSRKVHL